MTRKHSYRDLYVYMNDIQVGVLSRQSTGKLSFMYDPAWLALEVARPISLSMPLIDLSYEGNIVENFFDNLLPDSDLIRRRIQARFQATSPHCFDLLSYIGADCVGALQLLTHPQTLPHTEVQATLINDQEIATLLKHYKSAPLGMSRESDFRMSIAGAQEKTALLQYQGKWHLPHHTTPTSHIIKLPMGVIEHTGIDLSESVENEWLCLQILSAYGLPVSFAEIVFFEDMKTLVVERFDRRWVRDGNWLVRLPQEDLCSALGRPSALKYESDGGPGIQAIMDFLRGSEDASGDRAKFMKTVFLFWVMGAIDGHAKNFSLSIGPQGRYQLTPLYDVISAYPLVAKGQMARQKLVMAMALKGKRRHYKWDEIHARHWLAMADQCQFSPAMMQTIMDEVYDTMDTVIQKAAAQLPKNFPQQISNAVFDGMRASQDWLV